ncbi:MAG: hypothetical protein G5701_02355 [Serratia symbiotica]|nr:hypothetical protein [Serratia symbiotica]
MNKRQQWHLQDYILLITSLFFMLFLNGAIPFVTIPTLGQAIWTSGFARSIANGSWYNIFAHDFGIPQPAAIAFGLSGAWLESLFIRLGMAPFDAYSCMSAFWLMVAFLSAIKISDMFGAHRRLAILSSLLWMSMPIIWAHAEYSMLSLGIALLSFYFLAVFNILNIESNPTKKIFISVILYFITVVISVFMDGYTFMMFAIGASIIFSSVFIASSKRRHTLLKVVLPVHVISFLTAYFLFAKYIGKSHFESHNMDFFRGWGLDLSFIVQPTKKILWLPDFLGLSINRSDSIYFGDSSIWVTTFSLPIIIIGLFSWYKTKKRNYLSTGILLVATLGFYMALGPSLKINAIKPEQMQINSPHQQSALMPAELAILPTGNAWISESIPGFNVMRASYRWSALGIFALWMLVIVWVSQVEKKYQVISGSILFFLLLLNIPNLANQWQRGVIARKMFHQIDDEIAFPLRQKINGAEKVAFIPWGNDFLVNYLASIGDFRTFNIGGDKNLAAAQRFWPIGMQSFNDGVLNADKIPALTKMFLDNSVDVVVIPYVHLLWSAHRWPCRQDAEDPMKLSSDSLCLSQRKSELASTIHSLAALPYLDVVDNTLFAIVKLRPEFTGSEPLLSFLLSQIDYPIEVGSRFKDNVVLFTQGWHNVEENLIWSQSHAKLMLPVPEECVSQHCYAVLQFTVFGASPARSVRVHFSVSGWKQNVRFSSTDLNEIAIPLDNASRRQEITLTVPEAISPEKLLGAPDSRELGIALQRIKLSIK